MTARPTHAAPVVAARLLLALALLVGGGRPRVAAADDGPAPAVVQQAIDKGVAWLDHRFADGFPDETFHGPVELVVLTMSHAGANLKNPVFAKGVEILEKAVPRFTYRTALQAMALAEVNPRRYQSKIAHCAQWLVDQQLTGGDWGYPGPPDGSYLRMDGVTVPPPPRPEGAPDAPLEKLVIERRTPIDKAGTVKGDFSNTQFAILGLRAARDAGIEIPKATWKAALDYLRKFQRPDGGWGYVMGGQPDEASYASLTCAGICSTAICQAALGVKDVRGDAMVKKGLAWVRKHLDLERNANVESSSLIGPRGWQYYHLYCVERVARVLGLADLEGRAWYPKGAAFLVAKQLPDGGWLDEPGPGAQPPYFQTADTCFALLFLTRATRPLTGK